MRIPTPLLLISASLLWLLIAVMGYIQFDAWCRS